MDKNLILSRLDYRTFYKGFLSSLKENGKGEAMALCPFHDDSNPSLSVNLNNGLFICFGCGAKGDVFSFYQNLKDVDFKTALAEISGMVGVDDSPANGYGKVVAPYEYKDINSNLLYIKERIEPGRNGRSKDFIFKHNANTLGRGCNPVPYNLPEVVKSKYVIFVEGEGKVEALREWGLVATCLDSGANSPCCEDYLPYFQGKEKVVILPDNDAPGCGYATRIANALHGKVGEIKVVELQGLGEAEDIVDWVKRGGTKSQLLEIVKTAPVWNPKIQVSQFHDPIYSHKTKKLEITTLADVYKSSDPKWLVEWLLLECGVTLLTAYAKGGKTFLTMGIAICVATGKPLFDFLTVKKGSVLFVDNENGWQLLKDRYQKLGVSEDLPIKYLSFQPVRLDNPSGVDALKEKVKEINPTLIIFDSLTRFHKKKENESGDMAAVMEAFRNLANDGYTVLVIHHHRKGEGREEEKPRGSGDILASVDNLLVLKKEENTFILNFQTGRINGLDRPIRYTIENSADGAISFKYLGKVLSKKEELFELVKEILRNREMGFDGLHQEIKKRGLIVGEGKLRDALNEWKGKELLERPSEHNKKFYRVNPSFLVSRDIYTLRNWETGNQQEIIPVEDIKIVG